MKRQAMRDGVITEADTCREFVTPRLVEAGWGAAPHAIGEQRTFTNGRIIVVGGKARRGKQKRADYLLYYRRDYPMAVVEAKEIGLPAETGVQQGARVRGDPWSEIRLRHQRPPHHRDRLHRRHRARGRPLRHARRVVLPPDRRGASAPSLARVTAVWPFPDPRLATVGGDRQ